MIHRSAFPFVYYGSGFLTIFFGWNNRSSDLFAHRYLQMVDKVKEAYGLKPIDFEEIVLNAVDLAFTNEETKTKLRGRIRTKLSNLK